MINKEDTAKKWWILCIILSILLFIGNILYAIFGKNNTKIITVISGWVSGLATLAVGLIAYYQNKEYNFINEKRNILSKIENEQRLFNLEILDATNFNINMSKQESYTIILVACITNFQNKIFYLAELFSTFQYIPKNKNELLKTLNKIVLELANIAKIKCTDEHLFLSEIKKIFALKFELLSLKTECQKEYEKYINSVINTKSFSELFRVHAKITNN